MAFTKADVQAHRERINRVLAVYGERYGVTARLELRATYDTSGHAYFKVELTQQGAASRAESDYDGVRELYELPALGTMFTAHGERFRITGWRDKAVKRPVLAERAGDRKVFAFPVDGVKAYLAYEQRAAS